MKRPPKSSFGWPLATVLGGLVVVGTTTVFMLASSGPAGGPWPRSIDWLGGDTADNRDALRFMLASENPRSSTLVWALQAIAANNWARLLARKHPQVRSLRDMLQSGVGPSKRRLFDLGWGPQASRATGITRWASTSAGLHPQQVSPVLTGFARQLLENEVDFAALRGRRGELMPPPSEWPRIHSFLQYEGFAQIVRAQVGPSAESNPEHVIAAWGHPRRIAAVEGVYFYG